VMDKWTQYKYTDIHIQKRYNFASLSLSLSFPPPTKRLYITTIK
jgi:hypothetical protein